jgi:MbtH protein
MTETQETRVHVVVVNDEEQYSIWAAERELPAGWRRDGFTGTEDECLAHIDETWTDMRPASLRRWMRDHEQAGAE